MLSLSQRLSKAWARHPLVTFARHRRQIALYRQLHALIRSGIGLPVAFAELTKYAPDPSLVSALRTVVRDIEEGATLAQAFSRHHSLFDDANLELIAFAEEAGTLDAVLRSVIEYMEEMQRLRWRAVFMSLWPMYLAAAFIFVGPLLGVAQQVGPSTSIAGLYVSGVARNLMLAVLVVGTVVSLPFVVSAVGAEKEWDSIKRRVPMVSNALQSLYASRLLLGLGLGVGAGLQMVRAMKVAVFSTNSPSLVARLPVAEARLRSGSTLTDAIETLGLLDRATLGTLSVAERTGTLSESLTKLSAELRDASLRATRILIIAALAAVAAVLLMAVVSSLLGTILGPVKQLYDAAGSGSFEKN